MPYMGQLLFVFVPPPAELSSRTACWASGLWLEPFAEHGQFVAAMFDSLANHGQGLAEVTVFGYTRPSSLFLMTVEDLCAGAAVEAVSQWNQKPELFGRCFIEYE